MNNAETCLFCKIAGKEAPSEIIYEDEQFVAFKDMYPKAAVHILIVPKRHVESVEHLEQTDREFIGGLVLTAQKVARSLNLKGYRLRINVGKKGGQVIDHLHLHLLADEAGEMNN